MQRRRYQNKPPAIVPGTIMPLFLADETIDEAALVIARRLSRLADGYIELPSTWRGVAKAMNLKVEEYDRPGCARGHFVASPLGTIPPNPVGIIAVNTSYPVPEISRAYVHECAHADLHQWHPPQLSENRDMWRYEDDPGDIRHEIARRVEALIFGKAV